MTKFKVQLNVIFDYLTALLEYLNLSVLARGLAPCCHTYRISNGSKALKKIFSYVFPKLVENMNHMTSLKEYQDECI